MRKCGIKGARLRLITRWAKRCSRHYKKVLPRKTKRMRIVTQYEGVSNVLFYQLIALKGTPVKPDSSYHDQSLKMPAGCGSCVICGARTKLQCWGYAMDLCGIFPLCPTKRDRFTKMQEL